MSTTTSTATEKYNKLANTHILIIGGSSGIGFAVAEAILATSPTTSITLSSSSSSRVQSSIKRLQTSFPSSTGKISGYACDLSTANVEQELENLFKNVGEVNHVVFTAGNRIPPIPLEKYSYESIQAAMQIRFVAGLLVAKIAPRYLKTSKSDSSGVINDASITFTSGSAAEKPLPGWTVLSAVVASLHGMIRNLALDLGPDIRVNLVSPGGVDTEFWDDMGEEKKKEVLDGIGKGTATGRVGRPEDVAEAYLWLLRDRNVTGTVARTDGGVMLV